MKHVNTTEQVTLSYDNMLNSEIPVERFVSFRVSFSIILKHKIFSKRDRNFDNYSDYKTNN